MSRLNEIASKLDLGVPKGSRVIVAMSGGVDSSVVAALVSEAGYEAVGVTLQLYDHGEAISRKGACCAGQDIQDARNVADQIGIPHYVLDYEDRFGASVIDDFADTYLAGATPIPCVRCNERVKFRDLLGTARDLGGAAMATGHYIRRLVGPNGAELHRARDLDKDQSYFLFATTKDQLEFLRFPLGDLAKSETRELAEELGLAVASKPDSQDICFVPNGDYRSVIEKLRPEASAPGEIVTVDGEVLGMHPGVLHYTVGQRRGLGVATGDPLYVVKVDAESRRVIVGPREALKVSRIVLKDVSWLGARSLDAAVGEEIALAVKVRSTRPPVPARLKRHRANNGPIAVDLELPEEGVSPGQACVFYSDTSQGRVLGGGWIASAESAFEYAA
ncbi:MAG: tRNA 2-thiouridine(34) synthase MnmA [Pseudomonadota bacterium]